MHFKKEVKVLRTELSVSQQFNLQAQFGLQGNHTLSNRTFFLLTHQQPLLSQPHPVCGNSTPCLFFSLFATGPLLMSFTLPVRPLPLASPCPLLLSLRETCPGWPTLIVHSFITPTLTEHLILARPPYAFPTTLYNCLIK